jgi:uncharacterized protein
MKRQRFAFATIALMTLISWSCSSQKATVEALERRIKQLEAAAPGVGEMMSGVQLHFAKLHYAARAANWKLADFEIGEIEESLDKAALLRPEENGVQLAGVVEALKQTQLAAMKKAVGLGEMMLFSKNYDETMAACNSCHRNTGRPFIVITPPTTSPVANQQWNAPSEK